MCRNLRHILLWIVNCDLILQVSAPAMSQRRNDRNATTDIVSHRSTNTLHNICFVIGPEDPCMVYLPTWMVDFYGKCR